MPSIQIRGARTHHLKNLDLDLPRDAWTVVCGVSGSGKSSLVLDTLGAESYRRFLGTLERGGATEGLVRPDVDRVDGLPPAVLAGFDGRAPGPRETLASVADVLDGLRTLWARAAVPHCPACGRAVAAVAPERVIEALLARPAGTRVVLLAPRGRGPDGVAAAQRDGYVRVRVAGALVRLDEAAALEVAADARVEVVVDRLVVRPDARARFADSVDQGFRTGGGVLTALVEPATGAAAPTEEVAFADRPFCAACGVAYPPLAPGLFSANGPAGACATCQGLGSVPHLDPERVLPREERLSRARARVLVALAKADRPGATRAFARVTAAAGLTGRDRVAALPERARARLLGDAKRPGLLAALAARDRGGAFSTERPCATCGGRRLAPFPAAARLAGTTLPDLLARSVADATAVLGEVAFAGGEGALARPVRDDVLARLRFLAGVGLGYVDLGRPAGALSGGELRRARLAAACAARMSGLLFLLDEPTMGLHPADRAALRTRLRALTTEGNTVVCVEHDPAVLREADHVVELGPGAGVDGGRILAQGSAAAVLAEGTAPIARALLDAPAKPRRAPRHTTTLRVVGAKARTLAGVNAAFAAPGLTCVTGVSGAGKSTLVLDVLAPAARAVIARAPFPSHLLAALDGFDGFDRVSVSEGAPSRHPRASAGSVLGVLAPLRDLFAATVEARARGLTPSRFSTAVAGGRCEACRGLGRRSVRLRHLPELTAPCDVCEGRRFRRDVLDVRVKGLSFADVLDLPLARAAEVFRDLEGVGRPLRAATDVGLGYVPLGEATERLSGGEALRLRLAAALGRAGRARTLYLLDEPCAGLHPADVAHLATVLLALSEAGDAVVAVEHHPGLVRLADHVVDLGPGAGPQGGRVVVEGPPATVARHRASRTAPFLR